MGNVQDIQGVIDLLKVHEAKCETRDAVIDEKFTRMGERFTRIDERFTRIDEKFSDLKDGQKDLKDSIDKIGDRMWWMMGILTVGLFSVIVAILQ